MSAANAAISMPAPSSAVEVRRWSVPRPMGEAGRAASQADACAVAGSGACRTRRGRPRAERGAVAAQHDGEAGPSRRPRRSRVRLRELVRGVGGSNALWRCGRSSVITSVPPSLLDGHGLRRGIGVGCRRMGLQPRHELRTGLEHRVRRRFDRQPRPRRRPSRSSATARPARRPASGERPVAGRTASSRSSAATTRSAASGPGPANSSPTHSTTNGDTPGTGSWHRPAPRRPPQRGPDRRPFRRRTASGRCCRCRTRGSARVGRCERTWRSLHDRSPRTSLSTTQAPSGRPSRRLPAADLDVATGVGCVGLPNRSRRRGWRCPSRLVSGVAGVVDDLDLQAGRGSGKRFGNRAAWAHCRSGRRRSFSGRWDAPAAAVASRLLRPPSDGWVAVTLARDRPIGSCCRRGSASIPKRPVSLTSADPWSDVARRVGERSASADLVESAGVLGLACSVVGELEPQSPV